MSVHQSCTNVRIRPLLSYYLLNVPQIFQTINNHGRAKISALLRVQVFLGNAQSVTSRNVWKGLSSELNAIHRNLLKTPESSEGDIHTGGKAS